MRASAISRHDSSESVPDVQQRRNGRSESEVALRTFWFTGLSGAGKSTLAAELGAVLAERDQRWHILDGDAMRTGLCSDLGFSDADRAENVRRIAEAARLLNDAGVHAIVAVISPYRVHRDAARRIVGADRFLEIHVDTGLATCIERDPKGLYAKARAGRLPNFTGISAVYERPTAADLVIRTEAHSIVDCRAILEGFARPFVGRGSGFARVPA